MHLSISIAHMRDYVHYLRKIACFLWLIPLSFTHAEIPTWVKTKTCTNPQCAIGWASKKEGESSAIARALKELRLSLGTQVQAEYHELTNQHGKSMAQESIRIYAGMHNIGYNILARYEDKNTIYVQIQYDPSKKLHNQAPAPEFRELEHLERLCKDASLSGYYCVSIGDAYQHGELELARNPTIALTYYKKACLMGTLEGCVLAGQIAASSSDVRWYFAHACENGYGLGCSTLARIESSARKQLDLYTKGCALNDDISCAYMGEVYATGKANLQINPQKALQFYKQAKSINPYGIGAALLAQAQNNNHELEQLCKHNNARACAILGQWEAIEQINPTSTQASPIKPIDVLLQKAFTLHSPHAAYALALLASQHNARINFLERSCEWGGDFVKACELLGDEARDNGDTKRAQELYSTSCNNLFAEISACEKLYALAPEACDNNLCLAFKEYSSKASANALELSNTIDAILEGTSPSITSPSITNSASTNPTSTAPQDANNASFLAMPLANDMQHKKARFFYVFSDVVLGVDSRAFMAQARLMNDDDIDDDDDKDDRDDRDDVDDDRNRRIVSNPTHIDLRQSPFIIGVRIGAELYPKDKVFMPFIASFIELTRISIFASNHHATSWLVGPGAHIGARYEALQLYGIINYLFALSQSPLTHVPHSALGVGAGVHGELAFLRLGVQYLYRNYYANSASISMQASHSLMLLLGIRL